MNSVHAIARRISPVPGSGGVEAMEWQNGADSYTIHCLHSLTGLKFLLSTNPNHSHCDVLLYKIYELYSDYALKDPFYVPEMPIRNELFDKQLIKASQ